MRVIASCLSSLLLVGLAVTPTAATEASPVTPAAAAEASPVRINIGLTDPADAPAVLAALGDLAQDGKPVAGLSAVTVEVPAGAADATLATLTADTAHVRYAERDGVVHADSDPFDGNNQGQYDYDRILEAKSWGTGSPSVTVAVVDTGVSANTDLPASRLTAGHDFVDGDADAADDDDHGTMVATLIAGEADNGAGSSGICSRCAVMPVRALSHRSTGVAEGSSADVAAGIVWAADHGAQVINVSASTVTPSRLLTEAVIHAAAKGSLVVAAAGNAGGTEREYPAAIEPALAVGAELMGQTANGTNLNTYTDRWIDVAAAESLYTMDRKSGNTVITDTSASSAVVAGIAALGFSVKPGNTAGQVRSALVDGALRPRYEKTAFDPPIVDAAYTVHRLGGADTTEPVFKAAGLTAGQTLTQVPVVLTPEVTDDHAIQRLEEIAGNRVVSVSAAGDWKTLYVQAPDGVRGDLPVTIRAYDYAGNYADVTTVVKTDTTSPIASIVSPAAGAHVRSGPVKVRVRVAAGSSPVEQVFSSQENGPRNDFTRVPGTNDWVGTVLPYPQGNFQVDVRGENGYTVVRTLKLVIDDSGPTMSITKAPGNKAKVKGTVKVYVKASDASGIARVELIVNGKVVAKDTISAYVLSLNVAKQKKTMRVRVRAYDKLGNLRYTSARTWYRK